MLRKFRGKPVIRQYEAVYVCKEDGHHGASYRYETLEEAEEGKRLMEQAWGAEQWDVVIIRHEAN